MTTRELIEDLPGAERVIPGLEDLANGLRTVDALLVASAASRLQELGLVIAGDLPTDPEHRLYDLLAESNGDETHSRYNALIRRLVSFKRALEHRRRSTNSSLNG